MWTRCATAIPMRSFTIILVLVLGCKGQPTKHRESESETGSTPRKLSVKDEEVRRILVQEAALEKRSQARSPRSG